MPSVISSNGQTFRKNSYASSAQVKLSLRANGEEVSVVISPSGDTAVAGFESPTVAPVVTDTGAGNVPQGYYQYVYAYASSLYPFSENDLAYSGLEFPRSNPSPSGAVNVSGASTVSVQVTTTQRSDVDYILIFRTLPQTTAPLAQAQADAGNLFYVGNVFNDPTLPTVLFTDNNASDTGEKVEVDNFPCPLFLYTVFDGTYWWGWGNRTFVAQVTLDGSSVITLDSGSWYSGRNGQTANLIGIEIGGYDQRGGFYFHWLSATTAELTTDPEFTQVVDLTAVGTTQITIRGPETTLYRSKPRNPFSWGRTTQINDTSDPTLTIYFSDLWAEKIGGGYGTGLALIPNEGYLKLDTEAPQKSYALDLGAADSDAFMSTLRTLDEAQSTGSNFSQFPMRVGKQVVVGSVNAKSNQLLSADAQTQVPVGDNAIRTLRRVDTQACDSFHGLFDYRTELNCWFLKTTDSPRGVDTLIYQHAPTGLWGTQYCPGITASASIFDYETRKHFSLVADDQGYIMEMFSESVFQNVGDILAGTGTTMVYNADFNRYILYLAILDSGLLTKIGDNTVTAGVADSSAYLVGQRVTLIPNVGGADPLLGTVVGLALGEINVQTDMEVNYLSSFGTVAVAPGGGVPFVIVSSSGSKVYLVDYLGALGEDGSGIDPPPGYVSISVGDAGGGNGLSGINLPSGNWESIETIPEDWTIYVGNIPCLLRRYYNSGTPESNKRTLELWTSLKSANNAALIARHIQEYDEEELGVPLSVTKLSLNQDIRGASGVLGSCRYFTQACPSIILPAIGMDLMEFGTGQFRVYDFTIKQAKV